MAGWTFSKEEGRQPDVFGGVLCNRNFLGDTFVYFSNLWKQRKNTMSGSNKLA